MSTAFKHPEAAVISKPRQLGQPSLPGWSIEAYLPGAQCANMRIDGNALVPKKKWQNMSDRVLICCCHAHTAVDPSIWKIETQLLSTWQGPKALLSTLPQVDIAIHGSIYTPIAVVSQPIPLSCSQQPAATPCSGMPWLHQARAIACKRSETG